MKKTLHFEKCKMEGKWFKEQKKPTFDSLIRPDMCSIWKKEEANDRFRETSTNTRADDCVN